MMTAPPARAGLGAAAGSGCSSVATPAPSATGLASDSSSAGSSASVATSAPSATCPAPSSSSQRAPGACSASSSGVASASGARTSSPGGGSSMVPLPVVLWSSNCERALGMGEGCPGREIFKGGLRRRRADVPPGADGPLGGCSRLGHIRGSSEDHQRPQMHLDRRAASHCVCSSGLRPISAVFKPARTIY